MGNTVKRNYPYPGSSIAPNGPQAFQTLAEAVDTDVEALENNLPRYLGRGKTTAAVILGQDPAWTDLATLSASSRGKECSAVWFANYCNKNSGAHRTAVFRVTVDGTEIQRWTADAPYRLGESPYLFAGFEVTSEPAGTVEDPVAHVWKLQGYASWAQAVEVGSATISVTESD